MSEPSKTRTSFYRRLYVAWLISQGSDMPFILIFFGVLGGALAFGFMEEHNVERALEKYGPPVYVRHEIVHNRHVVERFPLGHRAAASHHSRALEDEGLAARRDAIERLRRGQQSVGVCCAICQPAQIPSVLTLLKRRVRARRIREWPPPCAPWRPPP